MRTYKEQRIAEREDFRRFVVGVILVVLAIWVMVWIIGYGIIHYQNGMNTSMDRGYSKAYCQYLMK